MSKLKERREALGLTLRDVERATKGRVSNAYLSQIENGKIGNPSLGVAIEIAATYGIPVETLIEWLGQKPIATPPVLCPTCRQIIKDHPHD